jgi:cyanophycinase
MSSLTFGLLGSGEFEPWTETVDRWMLERATGDGSVLIAPTASAPEGDRTFDRWARLGRDHFDRLGIRTTVLPLKKREDAERPDIIHALYQSSMIFFSGGNPSYLAGVLSGSSFWEAMLEQMDRGLAYGGCSAGVACLGDSAVDSTILDFTSPELWKPGLQLFRNVLFGPHWDRLDVYVPGLQEMFVSAVPAGSTLIGIDERTSMMGDGEKWSVAGSGSVHLIQAGAFDSFAAGQVFTAPILPAAQVESLPPDTDTDPRTAG